MEFDRQAQLRDFLDKQAQNSNLADDVLQEEAKEDAARAKDETEIKVAEGDLSQSGTGDAKGRVCCRGSMPKKPGKPWTKPKRPWIN